MWKNLITLLTPTMLIQVALTLSWSLFPINTTHSQSHTVSKCLSCRVWQVERWSLRVSVPGVAQDRKATGVSPLFLLNVSGQL